MINRILCIALTVYVPLNVDCKTSQLTAGGTPNQIRVAHQLIHEGYVGYPADREWMLGDVAIAYARHGMFEQAWDTFIAMIGSQGLPDCLCKIAEEQLRRGNQAAAVTLLSRGVMEFQNRDARLSSVEANRLLARCYCQLGLYKHALETYQSAGLHPSALCWAGLGDVNQVKNELKRQSSEGSRRPWVSDYLDVGRELVRSDRCEECIAIWRSMTQNDQECRDELNRLVFTLAAEDNMSLCERLLAACGRLGYDNTVNLRAISNSRHFRDQFVSYVRKADIRLESFFYPAAPSATSGSVINDRVLHHLQLAEIECARGCRSNSFQQCEFAAATLKQSRVLFENERRRIEPYNSMLTDIACSYARIGCLQEAMDLTLPDLRNHRLTASRIGAAFTGIDGQPIEDHPAFSSAPSRRIKVCLLLGAACGFHLDSHTDHLRTFEMVRRHQHNVDLLVKFPHHKFAPYYAELVSMVSDPAENAQLFESLLNQHVDDDVLLVLLRAACRSETCVSTEVLRNAAIGGSARLGIAASLELARTPSVDRTDVINRLVALTKSNDADTRYAAVRAIVELSDDPNDTPLDMKALLTDEDIDIRLLASLFAETTDEIRFMLMDTGMKHSKNSWLMARVAREMGSRARSNAMFIPLLHSLFASENHFAILSAIDGAHHDAALYPACLVSLEALSTGGNSQYINNAAKTVLNDLRQREAANAATSQPACS